MVKKNLSRYQVGDLEVELGGKEYVLKPPNSARGVMLMRIVTLGWQVATNPESLSEEGVTKLLGADFLDRIQKDQDFPLERLAIGDDVFEQMMDDGIPLKDITMMGRYASYYWVFDEKTADKVMEEELKDKLGQKLTPTDTELPKL